MLTSNYWHWNYWHWKCRTTGQSLPEAAVVAALTVTNLAIGYALFPLLHQRWWVLFRGSSSSQSLLERCCSRRDFASGRAQVSECVSETVCLTSALIRASGPASRKSILGERRTSADYPALRFAGQFLEVNNGLEY